jgi:hypothetical protein
MSKKDFKKRTYKTVNKGQYNKDKTKIRKPKYTHLQYENSDNLSLVQGPSTVTCIRVHSLSQLHD